MRISRKKPRYNQFQEKKHRINQFIRTPQVRLIDENGQNIGVVDTQKALDIATDRGLDLVEVSPLANPPVAKIVSFSKMKYQEEKERRKEKAKQKKIEIKGIRLSLRISDHDKNVRIERSKKFLEDGDKVKIEILLRGREMQHITLAREIINKFITAIDQALPIQLEQPLSMQGGKISALIGKK